MSQPGGSFNTGKFDPGTGGNRHAYMPDPGTLASQAQRTAAVEREATLGRRPRLAVVPMVIGAGLLAIGALVIVSADPGAAAPSFNESGFIFGAILAAAGVWLIASRLIRWRREQLDRR